MRRNLWILCAALCLALLCACGKTQPEPTPPEPEPEPDAPRIVSLECSDGELTLRFQRGEDDSWVWADNPGFALDGALVDKLADEAAALDRLTPVADAEGPEFYGLYDARKYVTAVYSDGASVTWRFGSAAEDNMYYASPESDPGRICLASGALLDRVSRGIYSMAVLPELPALTESQLRNVTVESGGETTQYAVYEGQWRRDSRTVTDEPEIRALAALLSSPALARCVDYAPSEGASELCGLTPPVAVLTVTYTDPDGSYTLTVGETAEDGAYRFVTLNDDPTIYLMDASSLEVLCGGYR